MTQLYEISFDAHYDLVTIHPWADGNGRMARLLMNMLQFEFGLIPTKILKEDQGRIYQGTGGNPRERGSECFQGIYDSYHD